ncbi:MAG TPA: transporter substrate-binding domain-containing protein [Burkholderiaceae bacterium]|nr:transporter substrate-binding domain-containing protein [Burkholderiaceae bacterium]
MDALAVSDLVTSVITTRRRLLIQAGGLALLSRVAGAARSETVLRLARLENIPDQYVGGEVLRAAYQRLGITVEFVDLPAKRALIESSQGRVDGEVHRILAVQSEFPSLIAVRPSINFIEPSAFVKDRDIRIEGWVSIAPYSIGIVRGVGSSERGTNGMSRVEAVGTMDQLMQMVASSRVDVAVNDKFSGVLVNKKLRLDTVVRPLSPPLEHIPLYHFLHERHRDLVPRVEKVLREMQDSGELERVRDDATLRMLRDAAK